MHHACVYMNASVESGRGNTYVCGSVRHECDGTLGEVLRLIAWIRGGYALFRGFDRKLLQS